MIDLRAAGVPLHWRGYPVRYITEAAADMLGIFGHGDEPEIVALLGDLVDLAGPDEPADQHFGYTSPSGGVTWWVERSGGVRDERGHHGGHWTIYLPEER